MKGVLPDEAESEYSIIRVAPIRQGEVPMPTTEITEKIMNELNVSSGTGPDEVPARILRECSHELALPITLLVIRILFLGVWPEIWKDHWIVPLHKRGVTFKSKQYRGVHLTAQISKVVERVVKQLFVPYLDRTGAFGPNQFAYRQHRGARDALALLVMRWIIAFNSGDSIILYTSDVSGAFDRVEANRRLKKTCCNGNAPAPDQTTKVLARTTKREGDCWRRVLDSV